MIPVVAYRIDRVIDTIRDGIAAVVGSRMPIPPRETGVKRSVLAKSGRDGCWALRTSLRHFVLRAREEFGCRLPSSLSHENDASAFSTSDFCLFFSRSPLLVAVASSAVVLVHLSSFSRRYNQLFNSSCAQNFPC